MSSHKPKTKYFEPNQKTWHHMHFCFLFRHYGTIWTSKPCLRILLRNAENFKGGVIFKAEVHVKVQLPLGLKVPGEGNRDRIPGDIPDSCSNWDLYVVMNE